jgi:hypothetical protein
MESIKKPSQIDIAIDLPWIGKTQITAVLTSNRELYKLNNTILGKKTKQLLMLIKQADINYLKNTLCLEGM